jgi:hypothetical protein
MPGTPQDRNDPRDTVRVRVPSRSPAPAAGRHPDPLARGGTLRPPTPPADEPQGPPSRRLPRPAMPGRTGRRSGPDGRPRAPAPHGPPRAPGPDRRQRAPGADSGGPPRRRAPLPVAAAVTVAWAAVLSATPVIVVAVLTQLVEAPGVSLGAALRSGLAGWLLGHRVPLRTGLGEIGLAPLAVSAFAAWRVARAGVHTTRAVGGRGSRSARVALSVPVAVALVYGLIGAAAAAVARGPGLAVGPARAGVTLGVFGLVAGLAGSLAATGAAAAAVRKLPGPVRDAVATGTVAALLSLAAGAGLTGLAIAVRGGQASDTLATYRTGVAGQAGVTLLCLAYAPNLAVWAASYLLGPGFAIGTETAVRTSDVSLGALPALPVFAGLPSGPLPAAGGLLVGAPLVAAMAAGWLLARRRRREPGSQPAGWPALLGRASLAGPVAGLVLGAASYVSAGPLGSGRLAQVGPVAWQVGLLGAAVIAVGAVVGAAGTRLLGGHGRP